MRWIHDGRLRAGLGNSVFLGYASFIAVNFIAIFILDVVVFA